MNVKTIVIAAVMIVIAACQFTGGAAATSEVNELGSKLQQRNAVMMNL